MERRSATGYLKILVPLLALRLSRRFPSLGSPNCYSKMSSEHSRSKQSAKNVPHYPGSCYSKEFIQNHLGEFQCHLQRIAHYLVHGEGMGWNKSANGTVMFLDSDLDPEYHIEGPDVLHFRSASLKDVLIRATECWRLILQKQSWPSNHSCKRL